MGCSFHVKYFFWGNLTISKCSVTPYLEKWKTPFFFGRFTSIHDFVSKNTKLSQKSKKSDKPIKAQESPLENSKLVQTCKKDQRFVLVTKYEKHQWKYIRELDFRELCWTVYYLLLNAFLVRTYHNTKMSLFHSNYFLILLLHRVPNPYGN